MSGINPIGGGGWNNYHDYSAREVSPAERAEIERRREQLEAKRAEEARLERANSLVGSFVEAKNDHVVVLGRLEQQGEIVSRLQTEVAASTKPQGFIDSLVAGFIAMLGLSPAARLARALRTQSEMKQRELELRKRRSKRHREASSAASRCYGYRWDALDGEVVFQDDPFRF